MPLKIKKSKRDTTRKIKPPSKSGRPNIVCDDNKNPLTTNDDNEAIGNLYSNRCIHCGSSTFTIHEIEPRSTGKQSMRLSNRIPLCPEFHDFIHTQTSPKKLRHQLQIWQSQVLKLIHRTSSWTKLVAIFLSLRNQNGNL